jgi:integrase
LPWLWFGLHGRFSGEGIRQMLIKRTRQAGVGHIHPHQFRHTAAHRWLLAGGQEQDLARIAGWTPGSAMLGRYGAAEIDSTASGVVRVRCWS